MSRPLFHPSSTFLPSQHATYRLLPFRFIDLDGRKLLVNQVGEHEIVDAETLHALVGGRLASTSDMFYNLKAKHFLVDSDSSTPVVLLATKYRTKMSFLAGFTRLHIFVVTLRCDHSCHYCQVSRVSLNRSKYDMTSESASRALDLVFRSPARSLKIEFQGGEPLLNFDVIRHIVGECAQRNATRHENERKNIQFVVTTNLSFLTDDILGFLRDHRVLVSTSLDGPAHIHDANRPRPGHDAHKRTVDGIQRVREVLGPDAISALMTTTRLSLNHPHAIIDEYVARGFGSIFLRPISPYGFALKTQRRTGYVRLDFLSFYVRALEYIIELNRRGTYFVELYAQLILTKILTPFATSYVDLQSPAAAGIGVIVYNYDGDVYATDEARMLAEMGDKNFRIGNLYSDTYEDIFGGEVVRALVNASCVETLPGCADCALQTFCGSDPIENYATQGSIVGHRPTSDFCARNMGIIKHLLRLYHGDDPFIRDLFWSWVQGVPINDLMPARPA